MEGFYCHPEPPLAAPAGFHACSNLKAAAAAAAAAMAYECSTSSPPLSMAMEQLQGGFPLSFRAEASDCGGGGGEGDKGRMLVSIERRSTSTSLGSAAQELDGSVGKKIMSSSSSSRKNRTDASVAGVKGKRASRGHGVDAKVENEAAGYIHVRARRGQAMDSHSVAERLRREKISKKMKMLQSLVPGCEKLAGKALLDEIISYVQSLQGQVEFLSMKLATLNPRMMYELGLGIGDMRRPDAPEVLKTGEMPPHEEASQWMCQAASLAAEAQQNPTGTAQDDRCVSVMQLQLRKGQQEEEEELSNCMSMGFFPYAD